MVYLPWETGSKITHVAMEATGVYWKPVWRTRKQLTREIVQHTQRIQAVLEEANVKLCSVITDILGATGRRILKAMIEGETDAQKLAALGSDGFKVTNLNGSADMDLPNSG